MSNLSLPITFHNPIYRGATQEVRTYYETFLAGYNLVKIRFFQNTFTSLDITPCTTCHSNFSVRSPVRGYKFLLKPRPFFGLGHIMRRFGLFIPGST